MMSIEQRGRRVFGSIRERVARAANEVLTSDLANMIVEVVNPLGLPQSESLRPDDVKTRINERRLRRVK